MLYLEAPSPWPEIKRLCGKAKHRRAALAYVTQDLIGFSKGDVLVVDASTAAIRAGETSVALLLSLHEKGVSVYSRRALHAKVIVADGVGRRSDHGEGPRAKRATGEKMKLQRAPLGKLCTLVKGRSPISKTSPGRYPLVTTGEEHKTADTFQFDAEAVCIPLISSTGHGHASLKRVHHQAGKFALANLLAAALIKDRSLLSAKFLARYLMFTKDRLIVPLMTGAANMSISIDRLATVPVDFPALGEQERIVERLDEADELRRLRAQADRRTGALLPALFYEMFGDPAVNPRGWPLIAISELAEVQGGLQLTPVRGTYPLKRPYLRVANVQRGFLLLGEMKEIGLLDSEYERTRLAKGDLLLVEGNGNPKEVGRAAIWDGSVESCVHQNHLIRVRPQQESLLSDYLLAFVNSESGRSYFHGSGNTTSGLSTITTSIVKNCRIPVPPLPLQKTFAQRVTEIRELEAGQTASRRHLEALFQSMLHRAFNGELS